MAANDTTSEATDTTANSNKTTKDSKKTAKTVAEEDTTKKEMPAMTVTDKKEPAQISPIHARSTNKERYKLPNTTESVTREQIDNTVNAMNVADAIKYLPSIMVRQRYVGDTNAPVSWRTSGSGQSAHGLIYADGIMLSSPLGNNNNNTGSPLWNMLSPNEIERMDVMYGPFSAAHSGNSIGGVIDVVTKMPEKFEAGLNIKSSWQTFSLYNTKQTLDSQQYAFNLGDRRGDFSWRFDVSHLDAHGQPITYVDPISSGKATAADPKVIGAVGNANPYGVSAQVLGAGAMNHTLQDNFKWKFAYDITPSIRASYTLGMWQNDASSGTQTYLTNAATGMPVTTSSTGYVNINGQRYALGNNAFAETRAEQMHWMHGMNIKSSTGGIFDWDLSGSVVDYSKDISRVASSIATSTAALSGPGTITSLTGSGWNTADAKGIWRPMAMGQHEVSFGFHHDYSSLVNPVYTATNWAVGNGNGTMTQNSLGKTQTEAYWAQDSWDFYKNWNLRLGGRLENWHAFDGYNFNAAATPGHQSVQQADANALHFSPKFKLTWNPMDRVTLGASVARAFRFPTATELFQTTSVTSGGVTNLVNGNPNLKPEDALSSELSAEYALDKGNLRLSLFQERINNWIYSQSAIVGANPNGSPIIASTTQNVQQLQSYGIELSGRKSDVGINGLDLTGTATWVDSRITKNSADALTTNPVLNPPTATNPYINQPTVGALQPRVPQWRASSTITYRAFDDKWTNSVSMRYSGRQYGTLNNVDTNAGTYTGNTSYFVVDVRTKYQITKQLAVAAGIDNINNQTYWIYHPFPMRTYFAELKFNY
jgi:iron complex outermembrane receptor protein